MSKTPKVGLDALLRPDDSIPVLIDHQPYQFANLHSHEPTMIINNEIDLQLVFGEIRARTVDQPDLFTRFRDSRNLGNATARLGLWIQQFAPGPGVALSSAARTHAENPTHSRR